MLYEAILSNLLLKIIQQKSISMSNMLYANSWKAQINIPALNSLIIGIKRKNKNVFVTKNALPDFFNCKNLDKYLFYMMTIKTYWKHSFKTNCFVVKSPQHHWIIKSDPRSPGLKNMLKKWVWNGNVRITQNTYLPVRYQVSWSWHGTFLV